MLTMFLFTAGIMLVVFGLIAIRLLVLPGGEFHGTCGCHNDAVKADDDETVCMHGGIHDKDTCATHSCEDDVADDCAARVIKRAVAAKAAKTAAPTTPAHAP